MHNMILSLRAAWELYAGEPPYERLSKVQIMFGVMSQDIRPQFPPSSPTWLVDLAYQCWASNAAARSEPLTFHVMQRGYPRPAFSDSCTFRQRE